MTATLALAIACAILLVLLVATLIRVRTLELDCDRLFDAGAQACQELGEAVTLLAILEEDTDDDDTSFQILGYFAEEPEMVNLIAVDDPEDEPRKVRMAAASEILLEQAGLSW